MRRSVILIVVLGLAALGAMGEVGSENAEVGARNGMTGGRTSAVVDAVTIPQMLSYQGKLTDTLGQPVPDGNYQLTFRLYTQPSGGSAIWTEGQTIQVVDGLFSALLGSVTPISSVPDAGALYLSLQVAVNAELAPRLRIASAAYAFLTARAADADLLQGKDTTALDARYVNEGQANSVTGAMLVDGTVVTADIGDTAVTMAKFARAGATTGQVVKWTGSAWAPGPDNTGGGSGVTNVYQDTGIVCVPNPITTTGNVKLDLAYADARYVNEAQSNSITSAMITDANVTSVDIRDTTITTAKLKDDAVTSAKVLDGSITSADIRDTTVNTVDIKDVAVTMAKLNQAGATTGQVIKWTGSAWQPRNDSLGIPDNAWVRVGSDSVLYTVHSLGIARGGASNALHGNQAFTHVNLGVACTTGTSGQNYNYSTVGGGDMNAARNQYATVAGGLKNIASGLQATVGGGHANAATNSAATVGGGYRDTASNSFATVAGGDHNIASGSYSTVAGGGANVASGYYATVGGGYADTAQADYGGVFSGRNNRAGDAASDTGAAIAGGWYNTATGVWSFVGGGRSGLASGYSATVGGGYADTAQANWGGVLSGWHNVAGDAGADTAAVVAGGNGNRATGKFDFIGGGYYNNASNNYSVIAGGRSNTVNGPQASVGGGWSNLASGWHSTIAGGKNNTASATSSVVSGGEYNVASGYWSTVSGGDYDSAKAYYSTVTGGVANAASDTGAAVAGGGYNKATGLWSFVGGGNFNIASDSIATVGGGQYDTASALGATVGGGQYNVASGGYATVAGGGANTASGNWATVAGGLGATASGDYAFAVGNSSGASYSNSAAFNTQVTTASNQTRVGVLSKASGTFTVDHPLDPQGKILNHYFIEGPEMLNVYRGAVVLDASGRAAVELPAYFDALNRNPMVQLTGVGSSDVYVAQEVAGNQFTIGGKAGTKVYWQITGERKDVSAEITRRMMPVEQPKNGPLAGRMLDDDFLVGCMDQLVREGNAQGIDFRTAAGRQRYDQMKQHLREAGQH